MNDLDLALRTRLHRAAAEMAVRPLHVSGAPGTPMPRRGSLRPLLAAVALAATVAAIGGGVGLHERLSGTSHNRMPASTPHAVPSPPVSTPEPTPQWETTPFDNAQAVWDSTHHQIVAFEPVQAKSGDNAGHTWTWDGKWTERNPATSPGSDASGILVDIPPLHGVALLGMDGQYGGSWLWDGAAWRPLPSTGMDPCFPADTAAWDPVHHEVVVVATNKCSGGGMGGGPGAPPPPPPPGPQVWSWDGHHWTHHSDLPSAVGQPVLAWDPGSNTVALAAEWQPNNGAYVPPSGTSSTDLRAWSWTGRDFKQRGNTMHVSPAVSIVGAGWSGASNCVLVYTTAADRGVAPPRTYLLRSTGWSGSVALRAYPEYVMALVPDSTDGRLLVIGQEPIDITRTPNPYDEQNGYYVLAWDGQEWQHVTP